MYDVVMVKNSFGVSDGIFVKPIAFFISLRYNKYEKYNRYN